jgi:thioredoxin 1
LFWKRLREEMSFEYEEIDIDTPRGSELAKSHNLTSVPTTLINGRAYFVGTPEKNRAITILKSFE